ncbi:MAG: DUF1214 domain-containing protein [Pseudomonadota bacterium]
MSDQKPLDTQLRASWAAFCDDLKQAGDLAFREAAPDAEIDRVKGLRMLARNVSLALQFHLENCDPEFPELLHYFDPLRKQGGDNSDALYCGAPIDGTHNYRIVGHRGSAAYFAITVLEDGDTPWGGAVMGSLIDDQVLVNEDGSFEVHIGPEPKPGNWIQTTAGAWRVTVRQFFADWEGEAPMQARIDCLDASTKVPSVSAQQFTRGLAEAASWLQASTAYWADMLDRWKAQPNRFLSYRQLDDNAIDATPGGEPLICYWRVPADEVLVVRVFPPASSYWAVEFGNSWWETMDYRYHLCSTNQHYAWLEADGELVLVVSHDDPGHPNWLDPAGHEEGYITVRWIGASECPAPTCVQGRRDTLAALLPVASPKITPAQRRQQILERRRGICDRFGT